jgi:hypothetical protein
MESVALYLKISKQNRQALKGSRHKFHHLNKFGIDLFHSLERLTTNGIFLKYTSINAQKKGLLWFAPKVSAFLARTKSALVFF